MYALGIPTTRSLALISLPGIEVWRERVEKACIAVRMAPSFLRVGSFEALNPPANLFFIGGHQQPSHWEGLRVLGEWVGRRVLILEGVEWEGRDRTAWGKKLVLETTKRNAKMVAGWQVCVIAPSVVARIGIDLCFQLRVHAWRYQYRQVSGFLCG